MRSAGRARALEILLVIAVVAAGGVFIYYANGLLTRRMQELKTRVTELLEERIGRRVRYQSISPSVLGYLAVRDLTVFSAEDPERPLLRINRVKIYYNVFRLITTRDPGQALSEIQIANSALQIDQERDRELLEFLKRLRESVGVGSLPRLKLSGANIALSYRTPTWRAGLEDLFFSIENAEDYLRIAVRGAVRYDRGADDGGPPALAARVRLTGKVDRGLAWSDLAVRVDSLATETLRFRRQTFQVTHAGAELKVNKIQDRAPLDIQLTYNRLSTELTARFKLERLTPASLVEFGGSLRRYNDWLSSSLSASGDFTYNLAAGTLRYQADAELLPAEALVPVDLYLVSHLHGTERIVYLEPLVVHSPQGTGEFFGDVLISNLLPAGLLRLTDVHAASGPAVSTALELQRSKDGLTTYASRLELDDVTLTDFRLSLVPGRKESRFELSAALPGEKEPGTLAAQGTFSLGKNPFLRLSGSLGDVPVAPLYRLAAGSNSAALGLRLVPFNGTCDFQLATDLKSFSVTAEEVLVYERDVPANTLRFALDLSQDMVELRDLRARWRGYKLAGQAQANFMATRTDFSTAFEFEDIPYQVKGYFQPGRELRFTGNYGLNAVVSLRGQPGLDVIPAELKSSRGTAFSVRAVGFPLPLKKGRLHLDTEVEGFLTRDGEMYLQSPRTALVNYPILAVKENLLEAGFTLRKNSLTLDSIRYQDRFSAVSGKGAVTIQSFSPLGAEGWLRVQDGAGAERYSFTAAFRGGELAARVDFNRTPLARAGDLAVGGDLSGTLEMQGALDSPRVSLSLSLQDGKLNTDNLQVALAAGYQDHRLSLDSLEVALLTHRISQSKGFWDLRRGELAFDSRYEFDFCGQQVSMGLKLQGTGGRDSTPSSLADLLGQDVDAVLRLTGIQVQRKPFPEWLLRLQSRGGDFVVAGGPQGAVSGRLSRTGDFTLSLGQPLPVQGLVRGRLQKDRIESSFRIDSADMSIVNTLLAPSTDIIQFTAGSGSGNVRIAGLVTDPDWYGAIEVRDARMRFRLTPDEIKPINGRLEFNEKTISMPRVTSYCGRAKVEAEGSFSLDHWIPRTFQLEFYVNQYPGAHIQSTFPPVTLDGYATGAVRVQGDAVETRVEGRVTANQCRIALVRAEGEPPVKSAPLWIDLKIAVGRSVEFYWPAQAFPVVHTYAKQAEEVVLALNGDTGTVTLAGDVEIRGGEIFYFDRSFYLKRGSIRFDDALGEVDPWINALAEIRERDQNNEEIKIYLEANNKLSQFSPRFYSDPIRTNMELMGLIGGSIVDRFADTSFGLSAVMLTSDIIGQFGILSPFERAVRRLLNLDLFSIRTQFLQNILLGRLVGGEPGMSTLNPLDNTTVSLGKYVGTDLFIQALVRFQATDAVNSTYSIQPEGELNLEWTTPFFLLEWSFAPRHPENLFLSDNSIGLSWKFSY